MSTELATIERTFGKTKIRQGEADGYLDATAMCKANKRKLAQYLINQGTKDLLVALERSVGIPTDLLVQAIKTGKNEERGTWVHPQVAIDLTYWCNKDFAAQVCQWVLKILGTGHVDIRPEPTPASAPSADFSRLESMVLRLVEVVAGITEHIASSPRALPGQSCTVRQMCERTGWQTSTALNRRRILARARDVLHEDYQDAPRQSRNGPNGEKLGEVYFDGPNQVRVLMDATMEEYRETRMRELAAESGRPGSSEMLHHDQQPSRGPARPPAGSAEQRLLTHGGCDHPSRHT